MPSFSDVADALILPGCCMRKNPSPKEYLKDDMKMIGVLFCLYLISYWHGYHSLCIMVVATMNVITFQSGITFQDLYSKHIHLNQFDELDCSMESDVPDELSLKQREHGATSSTCLTEEQKEKLYEQFQQVVEETRLRNRKRSALNTARTPSTSTLIEESEVPPIPSSDAEDDYNDMPPLVSCNQQNTLLGNIYNMNAEWTDAPNHSDNHYLSNYVEKFN
jgi:hypothetical protein